jgi:hypothetical protein
MRYVRVPGMRLAAAAFLSLILTGCPDDPNMMESPDLTVVENDDLTMNELPDMTVEVAPTAQITVADVVGNAWTPFGDGGVKIPDPANPSAPANVHQLATIISLPSGESGSSSSGTALNGCTWNRYNLLMGEAPVTDENAGTVSVTGYDTDYSFATDTLNPTAQAMPPAATINCSFDATSMHYGCVFGTTATNLVERYIFVEVPNPTPSPTPLPSPAPPAKLNSDLFHGSTQITETFTAASSGTTYTDSRTANLLAPLPAKPYVVDIDGAAGTHSLEDLNGKFGTGANQIVINYSCDGTNTKNAGCQLGGITGLLIQTSLGKKWESFSPNATTRTRFGTIQCVDATTGVASNGTFTLPTAMLQEVLGSDTNQSVRVVMVRLKANSTSSGAHMFFETAGRGIFALVDQ